jgi:acyl carrier protein
MQFNENKLKLLISKILKVKPNQIKDNSGLGQSSNWDSIGHLKILLAIEQEFKINFGDKEIISIINYYNIKNLIKKKITNK